MGTELWPMRRIRRGRHAGLPLRKRGDRTPEMKETPMSQAKRTDILPHRLNRRTLVGGAAAATAGALFAGKRSSVYSAPMLNFRQGTITLEFWGGEPEE